MDVKSLYTNVPAHEAIEFACEAPYTLQQPTFRETHGVSGVQCVVHDVCFMNQTGTSRDRNTRKHLAEKIWSPNCCWNSCISTTQPATSEKNLGYRCGRCEKMAAKNSYAIQCITCRSWFHRKCAGLTLAETKSLPSRTNWVSDERLGPRRDP